MRYIQRCKQRQWDIYKDVNKGNEMIYKDVNKGNEIYTRCKQMQWDIYKDVNDEMYTKM